MGMSHPFAAQAKRLTESRAYVPHGFTTMSADLKAVGELRKSLAADYGVKVSVNDVVIKAAALASRPASPRRFSRLP